MISGRIMRRLLIHCNIRVHALINQSQAKSKKLQTCFHVFSRILSKLYVLWECQVVIAFFARSWDVISGSLADTDL